MYDIKYTCTLKHKLMTFIKILLRPLVNARRLQLFTVSRKTGVPKTEVWTNFETNLATVCLYRV